ncbi:MULTISPECIES: hypothetical protein [Methylomonas]|uniref:Uncharacterized protein n=2 Tax=Methylomonas TaxID=416 RepID=A0A126T8U0_9GAMM|nr:MULTISPECIES: hypothetical protein [Methylomonas]AMK78481.1 hypothetical protein JT25_018630 [Methylomonas denitrificans]OAH97413.1 hypothetical protein A1342_06885 [Methylomonas methanica]TCV82248.1 hypothetical protein EDE11_11410 [Methylomonas methanica]
MQKAFALPNWLRFGVSKTWSLLLKNKPTMAAFSALILVLFGDTLLPFLWHILHLAIEVIEMMAEHFLEHVFGVTPRQAEFIVFWTGLTALGIVAWRISYKAYLIIMSTCEAAWQSWCEKAGPAKLIATLKLTFLLTILGKTMLLFV